MNEKERAALIAARFRGLDYQQGFITAMRQTFDVTAYTKTDAGYEIRLQDWLLSVTPSPRSPRLADATLAYKGETQMVFKNDPAQSIAHWVGVVIPVRRDKWEDSQ